MKLLEERNKELENKLGVAQDSERRIKGELKMSQDDLNDKELYASELEIKIKELDAKLKESESKASNNDEMKKYNDKINQLNLVIAAKDKQIRIYDVDTIPAYQREIKSLKDQVAKLVGIESSYSQDN